MNENLYLTSTDTKQQLANEIQTYKYRRFCKYILQKVQGHSRQRHCLILNLKESKFAQFFISRGIALYGIEFRPYLSVLGRSVTKRLQCRVLYRCFETGSTSFMMSGESPFRIFNPSLENVSAICAEISHQLNHEVAHTLVSRYH